MNALFAFASACVFGVGLLISGLARPAQVIAFLDLQHWDPSLLFVMGAACAVSLVGWLVRKRLSKPLFAPGFPPAPTTLIDARLCLGAALFGVGWGLSGYCPGPALVSLGAGVGSAWLFVPSMLAGMFAFQVYNRWANAPSRVAKPTQPTHPTQPTGI